MYQMNPDQFANLQAYTDAAAEERYLELTTTYDGMEFLLETADDEGIDLSLLDIDPENGIDANVAVGFMSCNVRTMRPRARVLWFALDELAARLSHEWANSTAVQNARYAA